MRHQPIRLLAQPNYEAAYDIDQDPLWTHTPQALPIDVLAWYQCDHLGTPQELTDPNGQLTWSAQYKAWGEIKEQRSEWAQREGLTNPIRFQGQYHDRETGLHYNRYRYYDPRVGRFISKDPISYAGGLNLYAYAPNPTGWVDPLGLRGSNLRAKFRHNENGSLKSATARIRPEDLGTGTSTNASSRVFARNLGCETDDAGHAIGNRLGGSGGKGNVFPQVPSVNRGEFRDFEGNIAESVRGGSNVIVRVIPQYDKGSTRPHSILYQARVDESTESRIFLNPCSCKC